MAVMAKALNKPFYVVAESFKFVRLYPLKQADIWNVEKVSIRVNGPTNLFPPHSCSTRQSNQQTTCTLT